MSELTQTPQFYFETTKSTSTTIVGKTSFDEILCRERTISDDRNNDTRQETVTYIEGRTEQQMLELTPNEVEEIIALDVGINEFISYKSILLRADAIGEGLPDLPLAKAVAIAIKSAAHAYLISMRDLQLQVKNDPAKHEVPYGPYLPFKYPPTPDDTAELEELYRPFRDLEYAVDSIATCLVLSPQYKADSEDLVFAWYKNGRGGYNTSYEVCHDDFYADPVDHEAQIVDDDVWGDADEYHHPAVLEIRVDPTKRIEFVYTPELNAAKGRHSSRSVTTDMNGTQRVYDNSGLSIRLDLDDTAPDGIALDIGRSGYEGKRNGRSMVRSADSVGEALNKATDTGSHVYDGFEVGMVGQFTIFAEQLAVRLDLQHKEFESTKKITRGLGRATTSLTTSRPALEPAA